jgi:anti-anti-sigma regulatory factor
MGQALEGVLEVEGKFDGAAALRLRRQVMEADGPRTVVDFSHVDNFDDATLPLLTVNLVLIRRKGRTVTLRGLRDHQVRMLHHFGIDIAADGLVNVRVEDETR